MRFRKKHILCCAVSLVEKENTAEGRSYRLRSKRIPQILNGNGNDGGRSSSEHRTRPCLNNDAKAAFGGG